VKSPRLFIYILNPPSIPEGSLHPLVFRVEYKDSCPLRQAQSFSVFTDEIIEIFTLTVDNKIHISTPFSVPFFLLSPILYLASKLASVIVVIRLRSEQIGTFVEHRLLLEPDSGNGGFSFNLWWGLLKLYNFLRVVVGRKVVDQRVGLEESISGYIR
jgi:hypothetical protein